MAEERRLVTILFADVTGSTALGETLDPEDVRALMAPFFVICKEVITTHGGTLEKLIGDAVLGDDSEFADAERVLEQLGDINQLERVTVARKKASP